MQKGGPLEAAVEKEAESQADDAAVDSQTTFAQAKNTGRIGEKTGQAEKNVVEPGSQGAAQAGQGHHKEDLFAGFFEGLSQCQSGNKGADHAHQEQETVVFDGHPAGLTVVDEIHTGRSEDQMKTAKASQDFVAIYQKAEQGKSTGEGQEQLPDQQAVK